MELFWNIIIYFFCFILGFFSFNLFIYFKYGLIIHLKLKHVLVIRKKIKETDNENCVKSIRTSDVINILEIIWKKYNITSLDIKYKVVKEALWKYCVDTEDIHVTIRCNKLQLKNIKLEIAKYYSDFYILE